MREKDFPGWKPLPKHDKRRRGSSKLTERQIRIIRADRITKYKYLADKYNVSVCIISSIKSGKLWPDIE